MASDDRRSTLQAFDKVQQEEDLQQVAEVVAETIGEHYQEISLGLKVLLRLSEAKYSSARAMLGLEYDSIDNT